MRNVDLHFPNEGVNRRVAERRNEKRGSYPCPWAVNVRLEDNIDRRLRGGSRPGLTKYSSSDFGSTIADVVSIDTSSTAGASETLVVLVDSVLKTGTGGTAATPIGYLGETPDDPTDAADLLTDDAGNNILVSSTAAPATGFLVGGQQLAFSIGTSAIAQMNPKSGQVDNITAVAGTVPTNTTFGAVYRDRLFLAGGDNAIYASRQGDYSDWNYGQDVSDNGRAVAFQLALAGDIGPLPTAMISCKDSYMIMGSARNLWILRGDPSSGQRQQVSENVGIISSRAWCKADNTIFFLSETGVYQISVDGSNLSPLSEEYVPVELRDVNPATTTVLMGFEHARKAVHVYLKTASGNDTHWVYELAGKAWWPVRLQNAHSPLVVCQHQGRLLLAGVDGYLREIGGDDDDGTAIQSHVLIGPMRLGSADRSGIINMLRGVLANGSGTVTWRIVVGDFAEEASDNAKLAVEAFQAGGDYSGYVKFSDTWDAGRSKAQFPKVAGAWGCIWLQSTAKWGLEGASMQLKLSGRYR